MIFNSVAFLLFLPIVFILYWFVLNKNIRIQNLLIVVSSYVFYGWADWRFIFLLAFSTLFGFLMGNWIADAKKESNKKYLLYISVIVNLFVLGFFKYFNFFIQSFIDAFDLIGYKLNVHTLNIILPVGISFFTFQKLSYVIDIYRKELEPTKDLVAFFAFVSFFPQLLAGPIERAKSLLPQFYQKRIFNYDVAVDGLRQMLLGFFKKVVIADSCAKIINPVFEQYMNADIYSASSLFLVIILFSFQVYADFSGYSDIAIGCARLFGISLNTNFLYPYFSLSISETWRRWHISLSSWVRDYLYMPLLIATRNWENRGAVFSLIVSFTVIGFWHGANWTFIVYGFLHGLVLSYEFLNKKSIKAFSKKINKYLYVFICVGLTQLFWLLTLVFFRAESIKASLIYFRKMFSFSLFQFPDVALPALHVLCWIIVLLIVEWLQRNKPHAFTFSDMKSKPLRWLIYFVVTIIIILYYQVENKEFIYFQF